MSSIWHVYGDAEEFSPGLIPALVDELAEADIEHTDVSVSYGDVSLSAFPSGRLVIEDVEDEDGNPQWSSYTSTSELVDIFRRFGETGVTPVTESGWQDGYGPASM